jgi:uncharacterized protein (TIGR02678 family)
VRRQADALREWFARETGWPLHVDREGARLFKRPADLRRRHPRDARLRQAAAMCCCAWPARCWSAPTRRSPCNCSANAARCSGLRKPALQSRLASASRSAGAHERRELVAGLPHLARARRPATRGRRRREASFTMAMAPSHDALYDVQRRMLAGMLAAVRGPSTWRSEDAPALSSRPPAVSGGRTPGRERTGATRRLAPSPCSTPARRSR